MKVEGYGVAGRLAAYFLESKITVLLMIAALLLGAVAVIQTPREEEPQIVVPFADIMVSLPGASAVEVEDRVTRPLERLVLELPGVKYVYSTSLPDMAMVTVRFEVGGDQERSLVKIYDALAGSMDVMPPGASPPLVKTRIIDDVPFLTLTLWQKEGDERLLRDLAASLEEELRSITEVSATRLSGGRRRVVEVQLDSQALAITGLSPGEVVGRLQAVNVSLPGGELVSGNEAVLVRTNAWIRNPAEVGDVVVGVVNGRAIRLSSVSRITETPEPENYVSWITGPAGPEGNPGWIAGESAPAVTLSIAKRAGSDATRLAETILHRVEAVRGQLLPEGVELAVTRDYGETADEKASDLLKHLLGAILSVAVVIAFALGLRGSTVILISVPITFALTLFTYYLFGYTLNRVTLFALIFVTGIVVDDSIIVVENIYRHYRMGRGRSASNLLAAVAEVGNPTVLATLTVIASVFPMAFVGGLMGPYMRPMPIGASMAMTFSLLVALTIAPWLSHRLLKPSSGGTEAGDDDVEEDLEAAPPRIRRFYDRLLGPLLDSPRRGIITLGVIVGLLLISVSMLPLKLVSVKMLPFDNKSEIQVLVDMPEGTPLEMTALAAEDVARSLTGVPEVTDLQVYVGTGSPITFNGLVRHYDYREGSEQASIQVNLKHKKERSRKSHELASVLREHAFPVAERHGADLKIVEVPPGPPVLSTLVAEVYGPDQESRLELAAKVREVFESTPGVVDVDWFVEDAQPRWDIEVDATRAALAGVSPISVAETVQLALSGREVGILHPHDTLEPVPIRVVWPRGERSAISALQDLRVPGRHGELVPVAAVADPVLREREISRFRKNGRPVVYVVGEASGGQDSPVYTILDMKDRIDDLQGSRGEPVAQLFASEPATQEAYAVRWDGEWHITREVFRDLGAAFGVVLILIYMLIAAWFQDLRTPLVMMVAIPLSLVGIIPGHWIFGGFFTATSMIGFIALAGIMVRNGILLLDFVGLSRERGLSLRDSLLEAGAVRLRPILLTAGTVVVGAFVILFDPIFQGLAISLMTGSIASTVLTLVVVPIVYYLMERGKETAPAPEVTQ